MGSAKVGGWIALVLTLALVARVVAIHNLAALVILVPALGGGLIGVAWPQRRPVLAAAVVLIAITAALSLIGGVGLLYAPSLILMGRSAIRVAPTAAARQ